MATTQKPARWLWLPILLATATCLIAGIDLLAAAASFLRTGALSVRAFALPGVMLLIGALTLRLGVLARRPPGSHAKSPRWLSWLALVLGGALAVQSGAEILYALAQDGVVVLMDAPIVMAFALGLSCSALACSHLRRPSRHLIEHGP